MSIEDRARADQNTEVYNIDFTKVTPYQDKKDTSFTLSQQFPVHLL